MDLAQRHQMEQDELTAMCEADFCQHPECRGFPVELTPIGEQYVIPGTERNASPRVKQLRLF